LKKIICHLKLVSMFIFQLSWSIAFSAENETIISTNAMVASAHPLASAVGIEILQQGGNAVDAAVAMAMALSIAEPNASGLGGGGFLMIKMTDQEDAVMIDYREMAPARATAELYYESASGFKELTEQASHAIGVPGLAACAELALSKYGSMTLKQVLTPAIRLARDGIEVNDKLSGMITENYEKIAAHPATTAIYLADMLPLQPGALLKNEDLAKTFEILGHSGAKVFYEGDIARAIVQEVQQAGGVFELADLNAYRAKIRQPVIGSYRGYRIISAAPPTGGGTHLIELLNIMEGFDVPTLGHNTAEFIHVFTEAMKMIYADKSLNAADPDFYSIPVDSFIDKKYAAKLRQAIDSNSARFDYTPPQWIETESNNTSHLSVVDAQGNIVALTQSINNWFGCGIVVSGTGMLLNDHLKDFDDSAQHPNCIAPHKRPSSSIAPTIVLKDGKPFMTLGTPGGTRIISALAQVIMNVIDFRMSMDEAIEAARVHCLTTTLHVEGRIDKSVIEKLSAMGHKIKVHDNFDNYFGGAQGILIDMTTRQLQGGADSRRDGVALGF